MVKFTFALILLFFAAGSLVAQVEKGMDETDLFGLKGKPQSKALVGDKAIYRWADMEVIVREGKVVSFKARDLEAERIAAERRVKLVEEAKARQVPISGSSASLPGGVIGMPKTALEEARERTGRAERIAQLRAMIQNERQTINQYSYDINNPSRPSVTMKVTSEMRDVASARIDQYEAEIQELEHQQR